MQSNLLDGRFKKIISEHIYINKNIIIVILNNFNICLNFVEFCSRFYLQHHVFIMKFADNDKHLQIEVMFSHLCFALRMFKFP